MSDNVIDLYLTPRFWKGQLVYDGRRPLLVFQKPIQKVHIDDQKPYPPSMTRKLRPDDGILYELSQLKNVKEEGKCKGIKMLVCVTMYNEPIEFLERTLAGIYKNFQKLVQQKGMSHKDIAVIIIQDGILKLVTDRLHRKFSSCVRFFQNIDYISGKSQCKLITRINEILDEIDQLQKSDLNTFVEQNNGLPPNVPKNVSLFYQFEWKPSPQLQKRYSMQKILSDQPNLQVMACFKHSNAKKLSSHLWFFEGFCRLLNPEFCTLMDIGTEPYDTGLLNFIEALESNRQIGGVSGFMTLDIDVKSSESQMKENLQNSQDLQQKKYELSQLCLPIPVISTIFFILKFIIVKILSCLGFVFRKFFICFHECFSAQRAQLFEYNFSHMFDKNFQSFFKYLNVLPGAWSAYRYEAISRGNRYEENLLQKNYLKMVLDPDYLQKDYKQANVYLAEDRVLCLGIFCQKNENFHLQYVPQALAKTDPMDNLIDLLIQRRRWINSSYFAFDYVFKNYEYDVRQSSHNFLNKNILLPIIMIFSKLSMINTYFGPAIFFFALFTSTHETYIKINPPTDFIRDEPWILIPAFICFGYIGTVLALIVISLQKKANEFKQAYVVLSSVLGIYNLILIAIVVTYICLNYFFNEQIPASAVLTRQIIKYLIIINFGCLILPILLHLCTHPRRVFEMIDPRTFLSYLYYQAAYTHTFVIYAFCNVDDVTWGTKGVQNDKNKNSKESKYYENKVAFMGKWIAANGVISFLLIVINDIFVEEQNKAIILTAIGMYSTIIVAFKCLFGVLYHFRCIFLDIFCMRDIRYNANDKQKMEDRLKKRTFVSRNKSVNAPANTILPNNFIDDVYDEVRIEVGSRSARNFCSQSDDFKQNN